MKGGSFIEAIEKGILRDLKQWEAQERLLMIEDGRGIMTKIHGTELPSAEALAGQLWDILGYGPEPVNYDIILRTVEDHLSDEEDLRERLSEIQELVR